MVASGVSECSVKKLLAKMSRAITAAQCHSISINPPLVLDIDNNNNNINNSTTGSHCDAKISKNDNSKQKSVITTADYETMPEFFESCEEFIVKPDMLLKRRGKLGLVRRAKSWRECMEIIEELSSSLFTIGNTSGYLTDWIIEPYIEHSVEYYICIYSTRTHDIILFHDQGGVDVANDIESKARKLEIPFTMSEFIMSKSASDILFSNFDKKIRNILVSFTTKLYNAYLQLHFEYMEINPFTIVDSNVYLLDCAAKVDNCAAFVCKDLWQIDENKSYSFSKSPSASSSTSSTSSSSISNSQKIKRKTVVKDRNNVSKHVINGTQKRQIISNKIESLQFIAAFGHKLCETESFIEDLDSRTGASLKFKLLNAKAKIWTLVAGGGASVVFSDTICDLGYAKQLANYGEYSGAPNSNEVYQYTKSIFQLMLSNEKDEIDGNEEIDGKILLIGGGIANFTNISKTFDGIILALEEFQEQLRKQRVRIYVRRGGPNYIQGLRKIQDAGYRLDLEMYVFGPDVHMTSIVSMSLRKENVRYLNCESKLQKAGNDCMNEVKNDNPIEINHNNHLILNQNARKESELVNSDYASSIISKKYDDVINVDHNGQSHDNSNVKSLMSKNSKVFIFGFDKRATQSMLDFDFKCGNPISVLAIVDPFQSEHREMFFFSDKLIHLPVYKSIERALNVHKELNFCINLASMRSCYKITRELIEKFSSQIKNIVIIAEGVPDNHTRHLIYLSEKHQVNILGPSTCGAIKPGFLKIANTGGGCDQFTAMRLFSPGSVGIITKSGGLSSEMMNVVSRCSDGVFNCIAIGGDRYPSIRFLDVLKMYESHSNCRIILMIGEIGGNYELEVADFLRKGLLSKPLIAWCVGTCAGMFESDVQFGHAGAYATNAAETAIEKNRILKESGAFVPQSFDTIPELLVEVYENEVKCGRLIPKKALPAADLPLDYEVAKSLGLVRKIPSFQTSITCETGNEVTYNNVALSKILQCEKSIGYTISLLWFKKEMPEWAIKYLEFCTTIIADHGPCVSAAHNTIVASRAGKDLVSSLTSGLLTIGSRFGGAMDQAAHDFYNAFNEKMSAQEFVAKKNASGQRVMGIGHAVKSLYNPDSRVQFIVDYVHKYFPSHDILDFGQKVSNILLLKKPNLILNVDGAIGCGIVDMMLSLPDMFSVEEVEMMIHNGLVNGFFVLSRTIGLIGHYLDQKRLNQGLYRHPWDDISKVDF